MEPARQRALLDEFLKRAVAEYSFQNGSLTTSGLPADDLQGEEGPMGLATSGNTQRFERVLGVVARNGAFYSLTPGQCEAALNEIIRDSSLAPGVLLLQSVSISQWSINGQPAATQSQLVLYYGMKPCISTFLQFQTVDEFQFVKQVLSDLRFCKLNEKHLKPIKRGKKEDDITKGNG
jgi:hypothetical protein